MLKQPSKRRGRLSVVVVAAVLAVGFTATVDPSTWAAGRGVPRLEAKASPHLDPGHYDVAPPGVDVHAHLSTAALYAKGHLPLRPVTAADTRPDVAAPAQVAATAPTGTPGSPMLTQHVVPSCTGTGADGDRVQVLYAHEAGTTDRFTSVLPLLRNEVANVDDTFALSARETGGGQRVRWVHDATCLPVITDVTLPSGSLGSDFGTTINAIQAAGYTDPARKYLVFADAAQLCGIAQVYVDSSPDATNFNNGYAGMVARVDTGCWSAADHSTPAHELMHTLGGVQNDAPNATGNGHCNDESDVMCYVDGGPKDVMRQVCPTWHEYLYDCNHDDYYSTAPAAGSYLATHWDTANSSFLDPAATLPGAGGPPATTTSIALRATPGYPASLTGVLRDATGAAVARQPVQVQAWWAGASGWTTLATSTTDSTGAITYRYYPTRVGTFRLVYPGAAAYSPATSATATLRVPTTATIGARLGVTDLVSAHVTTAAGAPLAGAGLVLQYRLPSWTGWATAARATTDRYGNAAATIQPHAAAYYRWVWAGNSTYYASSTTAPLVKVTSTMAIGVRSGRPDTLTGRVTTGYSASVAGARVTLQYRTAGTSTWRTVSTVTGNGYGSVSARVQPRRGTYYRWTWGGTGAFYGATSGQGYLTY